MKGVCVKVMSQYIVLGGSPSPPRAQCKLTNWKKDFSEGLNSKEALGDLLDDCNPSIQESEKEGRIRFQYQVGSV